MNLFQIRTTGGYASPHMATYSHSKIGTYESCPQKYEFQYVDRIKGEIESDVK